MIGLFYDTETTGLPLFKEPSSDPRQPHIVQLAASLVDMETQDTLQSIDLVAMPDGWEIPDESASVHGITTERAANIGVDELLIIDALMSLWARADVRIGHNEQFDARIIRIGLKRLFNSQSADDWKAGQAECTARLATKILDLPPTERMIAAGRRHAKTPNLGEAYRHFFGRGFDGAHSALADVNACMDVYWAIKDMKVRA